MVIKMKERRSRNRKVLGIINVIIIVYIFTLVIGYSFFRESLKISGTVSTEKPKDCPFELQELTYQLYDDSQTNILFNKYYAEYSSFRWNDIDLAKADEIIDFSGLNGILYPFLSIDAFPFDYYDKNNNILSMYASLNSLYPFDEENDLSMLPKEFYKVMARPIYFVFENTTAYTLDRFIISIDEKNNPFLTHDINDDPLGLFDVRWAKMSDLGQIVDVIEIDYTSSYDLQESWVEGAGFDDQLIQSVFKESDMTIVDNAPNDSYYVLDEFQDGRLIKFSTTPVEPGQYLVLGIRFFNILFSDYNDWDNSVTSSFSSVNREPDGMAFKFWPSNFYEESAFHVRFAFDDIDLKFSNISEQFGWVVSRESLNDFYANPNSYPTPVDWWE